MRCSSSSLTGAVRTEMFGSSWSPLSCTTAVGKPASATACRAWVTVTSWLVAYSTTRPPVNSTPKLKPRTSGPAIASSTAAAEMASHIRRRPIRSGSLRISHSRKRPSEARPDSRGRRTTTPRLTAISARTRVTSSADTTLAATPMTSVTPKPRTGPEARKNSSAAARMVVMLESAMALNALEKPLFSEEISRGERCAAYSSRARSNTSTFASMARPADSSSPPSPGRVRVAPSAPSVPEEMTP